MTGFLKYSAIALLAFVTFVPAASARGVYFRGPFVGFGFGPAFYPGYYGWYGPGYGPWYGPWYGPGYYRVSPVGEVEISTKHKGDAIFVDGGFAGRTGELKKFPLRVGSHTIELRHANGKTFYQERISVLAGKKLKIQPDYTG